MNSKLSLLINFVVFLAIVSSLTWVSCSEDAKPSYTDIHSTPTSPSAESQAADKSASAVSNKQWVSRLFLESRIHFNMNASVDSQCKKDFDVYKQYLRNQTVWAVRMMESSEWPSVGIFAGMAYHMGNYDECLRATAPTFRGQYCLVKAVFNFTFAEELETSTFDWMDWPKEEYSVWSVLKMYRKDITRVNRQKLFWAICIPSTCKAEDLRLSLQQTLDPLFRKHDLNISVDVDPRLCQTKYQHQSRPSEKSCGKRCVTKTLFVIYGLILIWASVRDITKEGGSSHDDDTTCAKFLRFFSVSNNYKLLIAYSPETTFPFVHLIKIVLSIMMIIGYRYFLYLQFPTFNTEQDEMMFSKGFNPEYLIFNFLDVYYTISAFLMFKRWNVSAQKRGLVNLLHFIFFNWLRMVWLPLLITFLFLHDAPYENNGPFFDYHVPEELKNCQSNWWTTLLAANNIIRTDKVCLPHTRFISVYIQLTIIGGILLYVISKNKKKGFLLAMSTLVSSFVVVYVTAYRNNYNGLVWTAHGNLKESVEKLYLPVEFNTIYTNTFTRMGPYLLGTFAAYLTQKLNAMKYTFNKKTTIFLLLATTITAFRFSSSGLQSLNPTKTPTPVENAIYAAFNRTVFVVPAACLLLTYYTSASGSLKKFFEKDIFVSLGRLQYCAYVIGFLFQSFFSETQRTYMQLTGKFTLYWWATGDIVWIYVMAFVVHLTLEAPVNNLIKMLLQVIFGSTQKTEKPTSDRKTE